MPVLFGAIASDAVCAGLMPAGGDDGDTPRMHSLTYDAKAKRWVESIPPPIGTAQGDLYVARQLVRTGAYRKALSKLDQWGRQYAETDRHYPEALLVRAEALIGQKKFDKAHAVLLTFLGEFGGMALTSEALRLEFIVAEAYLSGVKRKLLGFKLLSGEDTALRILDDISIDYPEQPLAVAAIKTKADYRFKKGDHALAELEYARLLKEYPRSRYHQYALSRTAESALASFGGVDYDAAALIEAEERYDEYRTRYPGAAQREGVGLVLDGIAEQRAEKEFQIGRYYDRTDHLNSAIFYYRSVIANWPDSVAARKAQSRLELIGAV